MNQKTLRAAAAFAIPFILMMTVHILLGIAPFGDRSILTIDLNNQYISYYGYLKEVFRGNHGLIYSFSKSLGGDMVGLSAYYLLSPLNLLLVFFPLDRLPLAVELITLLKIGFAGLSCHLLLRKKLPTWECLIFSTAYAMMAYNIVYQQNIMWLDCVVLLPLLVLGIRMLCEGKNPFLYPVVLFFCILTNYYIGFMLCIFSVLYFLWYRFFLMKEPRCSLLHSAARFALGSLVGGGLSMWLVIPVLKSLSDGKAQFDLSLLTLTPSFHWSDFLVKFFLGSYDSQQVIDGLPNVYCGILILLLAVLFFLSPKIQFREKLGGALITGILLLSCYINGFNLIWHGFNPPAWFPYRYSFLISFVMICLAFRGYLSLKEQRPRTIGILCAVSAGILCLLVLWMLRKNFTFFGTTKALACIVLAAAGGLLLFLGRKFSMKILPLLLVLLCAGDLSVNAFLSLSAYDYKDYETYQAFTKENSAAVDYVKSQDTGFYRLEKDYSRTECDPLLLDFNGLSHYSSSDKLFVRKFLGDWGYRNHGNWAAYKGGSTQAADSFLGVKYLLTEKDTVPEGYSLLEKSGDVSVLKNEYAFPLGFGVTEDILSCTADDCDKFQYQNQVFRAISGTAGSNIYQPMEISNIAYTNVTQVRHETSTSYLRENADEKGRITYTVISQGKPILAYFSSEELHKIGIKINGEFLSYYYDKNHYNIIQCGTFPKGEEVTIELVTSEDRMNLQNISIYQQDTEALQAYYEELTPVEITEYSDTSVTGQITCSEKTDYVLFTIPAEDGWHIEVDGEPVEGVMALDALLAIPVTAGTHTIHLTYVPEGWLAGLLLTGLSLLALGVWIWLWKRKKGAPFGSARK